MGLIDRGRAAWSVFRGAESQALVRSEPPPLIDLPLRRQGASSATSTGFRFLPSVAMRKHARPGTWDLLKAYSEIPALRLCVDLLSGARARLEFEFYRPKRARVRTLLRGLGNPQDRQTLRRQMIDSGDLEPLDDHPIADFLRRGTPAPRLGFPVLNGYEVKVMVGYQRLLTGEAFTIIERRGAAKGAAKRGLPYGNIAISSHDVTGLPTYGEPWYIVRDADGIEFKVPMEDVLYRRDPNPAEIYGRGTGPAHSLSTELEIDEAQAHHLAETWDRGTRPDLLIVGDFARGNGGPFGLNDDETAAKTARLAMDWEMNVRRSRPHFFPGVDAEGKPNVSVHDLSRTMEQMQSNALRSQTWGNIAQVLGQIPPELRGVTGNSNRATTEAAWHILQTGVLSRWATEETAFIQERIVPEFGEEGIEVDYLSPVDRDWAFDKSLMDSHPEAFTLDEVRALAGKPEIPGGKGEVYILTPGKMPVRDPSVDPLAGAGRAPSVVEEEGGKGEQSEAFEEGNGAGSPENPDAAANLKDGEEKDYDRATRSQAPAPHGSALVPGQDQLDAEAALRCDAGDGLSKVDGVGDRARGGHVALEVQRAGGPGQRSAEGAVVELHNGGRGATLRDHVGESKGSGDGVDGHAGSMYQRATEVNRAAPYVLIDRIAAAMEPRLRDLFLSAIERRRGAVDEPALARAIEAGNMAGVLQALGVEDLARDLRWAGALLGEVFGDAGEVAAASLAEQLGAEVEFNRNGRRALSWAPQRSEELAKWARESAEETAREVVALGQGEEWEPAETAGAVVLTLGLAARLAVAILNHRAEMVQAGESAQKALAAAAAYRDDLLQSRGNLFASDQAYSAGQAGQGEAWRQAKDAGKLPASAKRYWVTRDDRRVCPVCEPLHGQKRDLDEPFVSPADGRSYQTAGPYDGPHDGCRCALLIVGLRGGNS